MKKNLKEEIEINQFKKEKKIKSELALTSFKTNDLGHESRTNSKKKIIKNNKAKPKKQLEKLEKFSLTKGRKKKPGRTT